MAFKFQKIFYKKIRIPVGNELISKIIGSQIIYITPKVWRAYYNLLQKIVFNSLAIIVGFAVVGRLLRFPLLSFGVLGAILWILGTFIFIVTNAILNRTKINLLHKQLTIVKRGKIYFKEIRELKPVHHNRSSGHFESLLYDYELQLIKTNGERISIIKSDDKMEAADAYKFLNKEMKLDQIKKK